jgi:DNA repair protein RadA/Sms
MATKPKMVWYCTECGNEQSKWAGQCPACKAWNSLVEEPKRDTKTTSVIRTRSYAKKIKQITADEGERTDTGIGELNRVLGGGIVDGSVILVGGDPGIGKSTLLLQMCKYVDKTVLYVTGEESDTQIKLRAMRLGVEPDNLSVLAENSLDDIENVVSEEKPEIIILDSIQTVYRRDMSSAPGSVSQVREATASLTNIAKTTNTSVFIVGHVTKEGTLAGPRVLEHLVDTVLYFEGDRYESYRILRAVKNRFGSTNEIGVFEMRNDGFEEIANPSGLFINVDEEDTGCCVSCVLEGTRPMLVEVQSLVSTTNFGNPRRMAAGFDNNRLILLLAVLEKKLGLKLANQDVYLNVVGGMRLEDRASDLSIAMSIISSYLNKQLQESTAYIGEISLTGEIRPVSSIDKRISECIKMGFKNVVIPPTNIPLPKGINIVQEKYLRNLANKLRS